MKYERVIFDLDGVLLDERPYWDAALRAALRGWEFSRDDLAALADYAFLERGLQRITKRRGCNSNWDLAAALRKAYGWSCDYTWDAMPEGDYARIVDYLEQGASEYWRIHGDSAARRSGDPLAGFGIDRQGEEYAETRAAFQKELGDDVPSQPAVEAARITSLFAALAEDGRQLGVCTGRKRSEALGPIAENGWGERFPRGWIVCADDCERAEKATGCAPLGKPHWFPLVAALVGYNEAVESVRTGLDQMSIPRALYVGDGLADFLPVVALREFDHDIDFVLVRSGVTDADDEARIASDPACIGAIDSVLELAQLIENRECDLARHR